MESARCPYPGCAAVYPTSPRARRATCPQCGREVRVRLLRHEAALQARRRQAGERAVPSLQGPRISVVLDDVRSLWNVGSIFRTADGLGIAHLFLCGITGLPDHAEVHRTALGAEEVVSWSYHAHPFEALDLVERYGAVALALERGGGAVPLHDAPPRAPLCLVVGNEDGGISPEVLARCAHMLEIPMCGVKNSLNVAVACGIALYYLATRIAEPPRR